MDYSWPFYMLFSLQKRYAIFLFFLDNVKLLVYHRWMTALLEIAKRAALEAGEKILSHYHRTDFERKADGSPVTRADMESHHVLVEHLEKTGIPILSEESEGIHLPHRDGAFFAKTAQGLEEVSQTSSPYDEELWIIDPLDGTRDFINKTGEFCAMIALVKQGRPALGVIYCPVLEKLYFAEKGYGAFVSERGTAKKISVSDENESLRFVRSRNHNMPYMQTVAVKLKSYDIIRGSMGIKSGIIAEGEGDFFFSWGRLGEWDVCAPEIIVTEAGGSATDCLGNQLFYGTHNHRIQNGVLFSNDACYENVMDAIRTTPYE
jgi:3'(2'), 5'-bisphosphate nucleotidase